MRGGHEAVSHEERDRAAVDVALPLRVAAQRLELRAEHDRVAAHAVVQRLLADAIAREQQLFLADVPYGEREHPDRLTQRLLDTPRFESGEQDFGVGRAAKGRADVMQPISQLTKVVDLAVERDDVAAVRGPHRLCAGGREIENGEASVSERDGRVGRHPVAVGVRPAMGETLRHLPHRLPTRRRGK
jgi:hypothetical protein